MPGSPARRSRAPDLDSETAPLTIPLRQCRPSPMARLARSPANQIPRREGGGQSCRRGHRIAAREVGVNRHFFLHSLALRKAAALVRRAFLSLNCLKKVDDK